MKVMQKKEWDGNVAVGLFFKELSQSAKQFDFNGEIDKLSKDDDFSQKAGNIRVFDVLPKSKKIFAVSLGKKEDFDLDTLRQCSASVAKYARSLGMKEIATTLSENWAIAYESGLAVTEGTVLSLYRFEKFKREKGKTFETLFIIDKRDLTKGIAEGMILAEATNYTRELVNMPPSIMTPLEMAKEAKKVAVENKLIIKIYDKKALITMGMNNILAVNKGSSSEPRLIVLEYNPKAKKTIAIVGKGITFDSGGLDLKPAVYMEDMKSDMAGAAAVIGIMQAISRLGTDTHVVGVIAATENMISGDAMKPGDIVTAYNKKTIEIINTDAEGRLILADALSYTEKEIKPDLIVDLATLTGACAVALGNVAAGMLGNNQEQMDKLKKSADQTAEFVWQLPLWKQYKEMVKSDIADVRNVLKGYASSPGVIYGAAFLENFIEKTPWIHLDIAATSWSSEEKSYIVKGGTGYGVRLLTHFIRA